MDELTLIELASRIKNETARANWLTFMRGVELEPSHEDEEEYIDDSDGVTTMLASDLKDIEKRRMVNIATSIDNPFEEKEQITMQSGINAPVKFGMTELHLAVEDGNIPRVRELLTMGANKKLRDHQGHTPCDTAALLGDLDMISLLR
jgi:ankyrin repeat protein